jgi:hypothetical protein
MATGKHAYGICDKTGFRYKLTDLVTEYVNGTATGMRVGKDVADPDHPQNFTGSVKYTDNTSIPNPRPDTSPGNGLYGWAPVWNSAQYITSALGTVTVKLESTE